MSDELRFYFWGDCYISFVIHIISYNTLEHIFWRFSFFAGFPDLSYVPSNIIDRQVAWLTIHVRCARVDPIQHG